MTLESLLRQLLLDQVELRIQAGAKCKDRFFPMQSFGPSPLFREEEPRGQAHKERQRQPEQIFSKGRFAPAPFGEFKPQSREEIPKRLPGGSVSRFDFVP